MASIGDNSNVNVLVTGASGFIASHVVQQLLQQGYNVRGTVRSLKNEVKCQPLHQLCPNAKIPLELVEADLTDEASWSKAVEGCEYVLHIASPFPNSKPKDENEIIKPAVDGTLNVLKACAAAKCVKRVVLTSSVAAISGGFDIGGKFDESTWTDTERPNIDTYIKSKTLAEKAAWDFMKGLGEEPKLELAVINPAYVMGPVLIDTFTTSMELSKRMLERAMPMVPHINFAIVDVRDVASAHLRAMLVPEAAGKRHVCASFNMWFADVAKVLASEFDPQGYNVPTKTAPNFAISMIALFDGTVKMIKPGLGKVTAFDNARMTNVLGISPIGLRETLLGMTYSMIERGMIKKTQKYRGPSEGTAL